jgi:hypothetical protein
MCSAGKGLARIVAVSTIAATTIFASRAPAASQEFALFPCSRQAVGGITVPSVDGCVAPAVPATATGASHDAMQGFHDQIRADLLATMAEGLPRSRKEREESAGDFLFGLITLGVPFMGRAWHADGYQFTVNPSSQAPAFESKSSSFGIQASADATRWFGPLPVSQWRLGLFGGVVNTDTDLGAAPALGFSNSGSGENRSFVIGGSSLMRNGPVYFLTTVSGNFGDTDVVNNALGSRGSFDTRGTLVSGTSGIIIPVSGGPVMADLRGGITYARHEGGGYIDSDSYALNATKIKEWSGDASVTLFRDWAYAGAIVRPFITTGVRHRFDYDHSISAPAQNVVGIPILVNGYTVTYTSANTAWHVEGGMRLGNAGPVRFNSAVRYEASSDYDALSWRIGATMPLMSADDATPPPATRRGRSASRAK